jgi:ATP-dependent Lhr-like helicase
MTDAANWETTLLQAGMKWKKKADPRLQLVVQTFLHRHFGQLTGIQARAVPALYAGQNGILISGTASGKTEAAVIPVAAKIMGDKDRPVCLYVAPTRALLNDLYRRLEVPLHHLGIKLAIRHGDRPLATADEELSLLLTTPESLDVLLTKNFPFFEKVRFIICDEIHQVLGTPRGLQLLFLIERVAQKSRRGPQRIALSATLGNPTAASEWFSASSAPAVVFQAGTQRATLPEIRWLERRGGLRQVIRVAHPSKVIVFANSRRACDDLFLDLKDFDPYGVFIHYSTLPQEQREYVESQFKKCAFAICVATSTLELGVDIGSVEAVLLYEPPSSVTSFLQRAGRGGRRKGQAWAVMTPKSEYELITFCALHSLAAEGAVEDVPPGHFYSVVVQQIFSYLAGKRNYRIHESEVMDLCRSFAWIESDDIAAILSNLVKQRYVIAEPAWSSYHMGPNLRQLYNDARIHSNIDDGNAGIALFHNGHHIANLPITPNQARLGADILYAGRYWRIFSVADGRLAVQPVQHSSSPIRPTYGSVGGTAMSWLVAGRIREILLGKVAVSRGLDRASAQHLSAVLARVPKGAPDNCIVEWRRRRLHDVDYYYYTFAGGLENAILSLLLSVEGRNCRPVRGSEGLIVQSRERLDLKLIPESADVVRQNVEDGWRTFSSLVDTGPLAPLLPSSLVKKEVLSQVLYGSIVSRVCDIRNAPIVNSGGPLWLD